MKSVDLPPGFWPAALNKKMAAAYCGLSVDTFQRVCPVRPIKFTNSAWGDRYLRQRLDEWLISLDPNAPVSTPQISLGDYVWDSKKSVSPRQSKRS